MKNYWTERFMDLAFQNEKARRILKDDDNEYRFNVFVIPDTTLLLYQKKNGKKVKDPLKDLEGIVITQNYNGKESITDTFVFRNGSAYFIPDNRRRGIESHDHPGITGQAITYSAPGIYDAETVIKDLAKLFNKKTGYSPQPL